MRILLKNKRKVYVFLLPLVLLVAGLKLNAAQISGELKKWHTVTLEFEGPATSETGTPNPFTDYRLQVVFNGPSGQSYNVPGYYAADGDAANTSNESGNIWKAHFIPDENGTWTWAASFRTGSWVAVDLTASAGSTAGFFDGETGDFTVNPTDKEGVDFRAKGMLRYVNKHHYQFAESGEYYIKTGTDSPENFFGYVDFDATPSSNSYSGHSGDWNTGDPVWQSIKGKNIVGALNYLSSVGVNSIYTMMFNNTWGDSKEVYPWLEPVGLGNDITRFDCSKLDQWGIVLDYSVKKGIHWNCVLSETENESAFEYMEDQSHTSDDFAFADTRKLYYRELIARFGHHLAVIWNLGEEINWDSPNEAEALSVAEMKAYAEYIQAVDPYDHGVTVHHSSGTATNFYQDFYGDTNFTATSIQGDPNWYSDTKELREQSAAAGWPLAIYWDETSPGVLSTDGIRTNLLWPHLMAGGAGAEWYLGGHDGRVDDFRNWEDWWLQSWYARQFYEEYLPFADMMPANDLISDGYCFASDGEAYGIYLPNGGSAQLDLAGQTGDFLVYWYDPRNGGDLMTGSISQVQGGGSVSLGNPPNNTTSDWAIIVSDGPPGLNTDFMVSATKISVGQDVTFTAVAGSGITGWSWGFGEGADPSNASTEGPHTVTYSSPGYKTVSLSVTGEDGDETIEKADYVRVYGGYLVPAFIDVTPASMSIRVGETAQFDAAVTDSAGNVLSESIEWSVSGGGTIDQTGLFTAETLGGPYTVTAVSGSLSDTASITVANVIFEDDFERAGGADVGGEWTEVESGSNTTAISANTLQFSSVDGAMSPLAKASFTEQSSGVIVWSFDMNWALTGAEGTYEVFMQLGSGMSDTDPAAGVAVDLRWGDANGEFVTDEGFGVVLDNGDHSQVATVSGEAAISVTVDIDAQTYSVEVDGNSVISNVDFRNQITGINEIRLFTNSLNSANFSGRSFDNIVITGAQGATALADLPVKAEPFQFKIKNGCLSLDIKKKAPVKVDMFSLNGKMIDRLYKSSGIKGTVSLPINTKSLSNGLYILKLTIGNRTFTHNVISVK